MDGLDPFNFLRCDRRLGRAGTPAIHRRRLAFKDGVALVLVSFMPVRHLDVR
jgi:hypothetical protein